MGKYIAAFVAILVVLGGAFVAGYAAAVTGQGDYVCEMQTDPDTEQQVCIVDGTTYVPQEEGTDG